MEKIFSLLIALIILYFVNSRSSRTAKKSGASQKTAPPAKQGAQLSDKLDFLFSQEEKTLDHYSVDENDHILAAGHDKKSRLEQLETLKKAGLLEEQEYREKRQEILSEM